MKLPGVCEALGQVALQSTQGLCKARIQRGLREAPGSWATNMPPKVFTVVCLFTVLLLTKWNFSSSQVKDIYRFNVQKRHCAVVCSYELLIDTFVMVIVVHEAVTSQ